MDEGLASFGENLNHLDSYYGLLYGNYPFGLYKALPGRETTAYQTGQGGKILLGAPHRTYSTQREIHETVLRRNTWQTNPLSANSGNF